MHRGIFGSLMLGLIHRNMPDRSIMVGRSGPEKRLVARKAPEIRTNVVTTDEELTILGNVLGASQMPYVLLFILCLAVVAVTTLSFLMSRSVSEPLQQMGEAMKKIREGELSVSIPVVSNDEIGVMAAGFNSMAEGLKKLSNLGTEVKSEESPPGLLEKRIKLLPKALERVKARLKGKPPKTMEQE